MYTKKVRFFGTSSQYRTSLITAPKKGAQIEPSIELGGNSSQWTSRFEHLRNTALSEYLSNEGNWGMALFIRQGMAAWMQAWPKLQHPAVTVTKRQVVGTIGALPELSSPLRMQITLLLADMILNRSYQEVML